MRTAGLFRDSHHAPPDASWESFNEHSLEQYFADGTHALHLRFQRLEDMSKSFTEADERHLWFMLESLIHVRHLLEEIAR